MGPQFGLRPNKKEGTQFHPSTENWIKDLLSKAPPIRTRPSFPLSQSFPSRSFHKALQFSSVTQSCPTLCDPMNHSTPGLSVHHQLPEFTQTHVHGVGDANSQPGDPAKGLRTLREFDFGGLWDLFAELPQVWGNRLLGGHNQNLV